jgi:hypothetical protein
MSQTPPTSKVLSPGLILLRHEDEDSVVYSIDNNKTTMKWIFTFDFRESSNFYLLKLNTDIKSKDSHNGLLRRVIVPANTTLEVARLNVTNPKLESSLKVHYGWEERPPTLDDNEEDSCSDAFVDFGKTLTKKEALSTEVDLVTSRTDLKDGHSKFVYRIQSRRRESLKVILDFTGSQNLALVNSGVHGRLARFILGSKNQKNTNGTLKKEVRVTLGTTRVAKLRTIVARQGWSLNHNVTFETRVNDLSQRNSNFYDKNTVEEEKEVSSTNKKSQLPKRRPMRRISVTQESRSSAGFESGIMSPLTPKKLQPKTEISNVLTEEKQSFDKNIKEINTHYDFDDILTDSGPTVQPVRMSWLDHEIFQHVNDTTTTKKSKSVTFLPLIEKDTTDMEKQQDDGHNVEDSGRSVTPFVASTTRPNETNQVYTLLKSLQLHDMYYHFFEKEAMNNTELLLSMVEENRTEFKMTLKEIGVDKIGHREQILRALLSSSD